MIKKYIFIISALILLCRCQNRTDSDNHCFEDMIDTFYTETEDGDSIRHTRIKYYDFDSIKDLTAFFDTLAVRYPIVKWSGEEDNIDEVVHDCIAHIDSYRKGEISRYPDSLVNRCIRYMGFNTAAAKNHSDFADLVFAEWVIMCAAYYCPELTCIAENQSQDHCAGFYNFGMSYNSLPWWPYLFFKRNKGFEVTFLGDEKKVNSVFQLYDDQDKKYYLFSNNESAFEFSQWLYLAKDNFQEIKVAECYEAPVQGDIETTHYYFSKTELIWKYAIKDKTDGRLITTDEGPALALILDEKKSRFVNYAKTHED